MIYKTIDIPEYDKVLDELRTCILGNMPDNKIFLNRINNKIIEQQCPTLMAWLNQNSLEISLAAVIQAAPGMGQRGVHRDFKVSDVEGVKVALNFGISVPENSYTGVYEDNPDFEVDVSRLPNGAGYYHYAKYTINDFVELGRFDLSKPTLFSPAKLHSVVNNSNDPRISLSLRFTTDPIWWEE